MKKLAIYLGKKYVLAALNDLLENHKDDALTVTSKITLWTNRLKLIISQLEKINDRVADGKIDENEVSESVNEIEELVKAF